MEKKFTVLIAGGAGLIGRSLAKELSNQGKRVIVADLKPKNIEDGSVEYREFDILVKDALGQLIEEYQPDIVINGINVATLFSRKPHQGYDQIIAFYIDIYRSLRVLHGSIHYIQVGTTGSGGLGFNIPFTHGDKIEDLPIINKAAFAGITTSMLTLLSRSFSDGKVRVSEIKPGLAIFADVISESEEHGAKLVTLDGGESGHYTFNETALLTQFMGFTLVSTVVDKLVSIIERRKIGKEMQGYDVIENLNSTILAEEPDDVVKKEEFLKDIKSRQGAVYIIATGNLGPPSVTRDLILGHLLAYEGRCIDANHFSECLQKNICVAATLNYIQATNPKLYHYVRSECSFHNYKLLEQYYRQGTEPWQIAGASLSKLPPVY